MRNQTKRWTVVLGLSLLGIGRAAFAAIGYSYFYDDLDRLTQATDSTGVSIEYVYDEVGNHLSVVNTTLAPFAILDISPSAGAVGTRVLIDGRGFDPLPASNAVAFNGTAATVISASATQLEVEVPASATTGPVSITVGGDTVTSSDNFQIQAVPVITGLSTRFVLSGASISALTVTGDNLSGSSFSFVPAFVPVAVTVNTAAVAADGLSADLNVSVAPEAAGTFVLQASNTAGPSDAVANSGNSFTVLGSADDDLDGDGLTNGEEIALGTDPTTGDTDGDGLPDAFEIGLGFDPLDAADAFVDSDNDGISNLDEFNQGTDPTNPDITPPGVVQIRPADDSSALPVNGRVVIRFTEPLRANSVTTGAVRLFQGTLALDGSLRLSNDGLSITFDPTDSLSAFSTHRIEVQGVRDLAGNPMSGVISSQFTTGEFMDDVRPSLVAASLAHGQADVPVNAPYTVRFDEPMDPATLDDASFRIRDNTTFQNVPGMIQFDASGTTGSFVPEQPLPIGRSFSVTLDAGRIADTAGNLLSASRFFSFTTGFVTDTAPPALVGVSPADGAVDVPMNTRIEVAFDEPLALLDSQTAVSVQAAGTTVAGSIALSDGNRRLTFTPALPLDPALLHTVTISERSRDLAGNAFAGPVSVGFTTGITVDTIRPTLAQVSLVNGAVDVPTDVAVQVSFSEVMNALTLTPATFFIEDTTTFQPVPGTVAVAANGLSATFTPAAPLAPLTAYRVRTFNMTDLAGNVFASTSVPARFTTGTGTDTTAPAVAQTSLDGATQAPVNAQLVVALSEAVDPFSLAPDSVQVSAGGVRVPGTVLLSGDRRSLTFVPDAPFATNTAFEIQVTGLTDLGGNALAPFTGSFTTGSVPTQDTTAPTVTGIIPANGATGVAVDTAIMLSFSEALDPISVGIDGLPVTVDGFAGQIAAEYAVTDNQVTITPLGPLPGNARVRVRLEPTVRDLAGNGYAGIIIDEPVEDCPVLAPSTDDGLLERPDEFSEDTDGTPCQGVLPFQAFFDTAATLDTTPPTVLAVSPADGSVDLGRNTAVVLTFSESLDAATINGTNFTLFADGSQVFASVSRSSDNRTVTLSATLPADRLIQVAVSGARDLSGNALADFLSQFRTGPALDSGRPQVATQRPGNGANNVPLDQSVILFISESLAPSSVPGALHVSQNGEVVTGTVRVTADGQAVEFTPDVPWAPDALVQVFLDTTAVDLSGNALSSDYQGSFRTLSDPTLARPAIVRDSLASNTTEVPLNPAIEVEFSEALDPATVADTTVILRQNNTGQVVPATVSLRGDRVVRVTPAALAANTSYFLDILNGVQDLQGQTLSTSTSPTTVIFRRFFTTGDQADTTAPAVAGVSPPDGAADVPLNTQLRVRFDEPVNPLTVDEASVLLSDGASQAVACSISFSNGDQEVRIVPHSPLAENQLYRLTVDGVEDRAGNPVAAQTTTFTSTAALDTVRPALVSSTPFSGATGVPVNSPVILRVDERLDPLTVTASTLIVRDNTTFQNIPGSYSLSPDGREIGFAPDAPFAVGRSHSVFASGASLQDLVGNTITGASFNFTTAFAEDTTAPTLLGVSPPDGTANVPTNARLQIRFDEPVQATRVDGVTLSANGSDIPVTRTLSDANRLLTLTPQTLLVASTLHTLTLSGATDLAGNALPDAVTTFTTGTGFDLIAPTLAQVSLVNGAVDVPTDVAVQVSFSEVMNALTLTPATFFIDNATTGVPVAGTVAVAADGLSATFTPAAPLAPLTAYRVRTFNMTDLAGNVFASTSVPARFTTGP